MSNLRNYESIDLNGSFARVPWYLTGVVDHADDESIVTNSSFNGQISQKTTSTRATNQRFSASLKSAKNSWTVEPVISEIGPTMASVEPEFYQEVTLY